jgi:tetratricopeptide (TPR) repeat protein
LARGTQHRKRRTATNARLATTAPKAQRPQHAAWEDQLLFARLRVHAKWVFVLLAVVFALSFAFLGVGTGANGIGDVLQNIFRYGGGGSSLSALKNATEKHPKDAQAWLDLANKQQSKGNISAAIVAMGKYTKLKPKDANGLQDLGSLYQQRSNDYVNVYNRYASLLPPDAKGSLFLPPSKSPLAKLFAAGGILQHPLQLAYAEELNNKVNAAQSKFTTLTAQAQDAYTKLVKLDPRNASNQLLLANVAQTAGDSTTAKKAYKAFLKLAPGDVQAPYARKQLKALAGTATSTAKGG